MEKNNSLKMMILLSGAKLFGIIFSFMIPMYLGRTLEIETYGTYKQLMLFFWFAQVGLNLGMDDYTYRMVREKRNLFPLYSFNSLAINFSMTLFLWGILWGFGSKIAIILNNGQLASYMPVLGCLILFTVCSAQLGGLLIGLDQYKKRFILDMVMEFSKSAAILLSFYFFHSILSALIALTILMGIKFALTICLIHRYKIEGELYYKNGLSFLKEQLLFGIPLGVSRFIQNVLNMENFLISSMLGMVQFTYYTVGSFENPLINAGKSGLFEVVNLEMSDSRGRTNLIVSSWQRLVRKIYLLFIPLILFMMFFAKEIMVFIFSDKYLASVPVFILFNIYVLLSLLNPEPIFRIISETGKAFLIRTTGSLLGVGLIVYGAFAEGIMGAMTGKIAAILFINGLGLYLSARLIKEPLKELIMASLALKVFFISLAPVFFMRLWFIKFPAGEFITLALSFSFSAIGILALMVYFKLLTEEEIALAKNIFSTKIRPLLTAR